VKRILGSAVLLFGVLGLGGCASTKVDMAEPRRIVGTENAVRVDAQISAEQVAPGAQIPITYEITNERDAPIAVAELLPDTTYDDESHMFTVSIGSEVPGNSMLPRLVVIAPGEKKTFSAMARLTYVLPPRVDAQFAAVQASFRLKLNFLSDTEPFQQLIGIKEVAVSDPKLADALFPLWLERNEVVYTNAIPMRWDTQSRDFNGADRKGPRRRGGV
jgi:hypothetical protein